MSQINVNTIRNRTGGPPNLDKGAVVTGILTCTGNVSVGGTLTYEDVTNIDSTGIVTAKSGIKVGNPVSPGIGATIDPNGNAVFVGIVTSGGGIDVTAGGIDVTAGIIKASTDGINATSNLILKTGGTEQLRIESGGDIGINVTNPGSRLAIYDADGDNLLLASHNYSGEARIGFTGNQGTGGTNNGGSTCGALGVTASAPGGSATGYMSFYTNQGDNLQERLRIGAEGQIGIGGANYGTTGQVFTSQGASAAPQWADAGGVWELIDNKKIESSIGTTYDISFGANAGITTAYARYKIYYNVWLNGGDKIYVRGAYGFSGTFANDVKTSDYWWSGFYHRAGETAMQWPTQGENQNKALIGANNNKTMHSGEMIIFNSSGRLTTNNSASWPVLSYNTQGFSGGDNDAHNFTISGQLKGGDNQPLQGVQIHTGSAMVSGEILTYRLKTT